MRDIKSPKLICAKAGLFVIAGLMAACGILLEHPQLRTAALLGITVWCFARAYYFAFYVIEHYIDDGYRYAGLWSLARYALRQRQNKQGETRTVSVASHPK